MSWVNKTFNNLEMSLEHDQVFNEFLTAACSDYSDFMQQKFVVRSSMVRDFKLTQNPT
jgi:hypothetical protein